MCFTNWYNYEIRLLKYTFLSIPLSHRFFVGHIHISAFAPLRAMAFEASLRMIPPAWAFACIVGWSWSTWTESLLGGTKLEATCSPGAQLKLQMGMQSVGPDCLEVKATLKFVWCEPEDPSIKFSAIQIFPTYSMPLTNVVITIKKKKKSILLSCIIMPPEK